VRIFLWKGARRVVGILRTSRPTILRWMRGTLTMGTFLNCKTWSGMYAIFRVNLVRVVR